MLRWYLLRLLHYVINHCVIVVVDFMCYCLYRVVLAMVNIFSLFTRNGDAIDVRDDLDDVQFGLRDLFAAIFHLRMRNDEQHQENRGTG